MRTKAAMIRQAGQPWEVTTRELDDPGPGEVLIKFFASGLCHSDERVRAGRTEARRPMVGGHEGAGVVEAFGEDVCDLGAEMLTGLLASDRFAFDDDGAEVGGFCALGTFSELTVISQFSCIKILDDIPPDVAALVGSGVSAGDTVVIFGAGGVGTNAIQGARYAGAATVVVVDPVAFKRENAMEFGATHTFEDAESAQQAVNQITWGQMADHAIVTIGVLSAEVVSAATDMVGKDGQVTITSVGQSGDTQIALAANGSVVGWQRRIQGHVFGMCNPLTHRYSLDEVNRGYQDLLSGKNIRGVIMHAT